MCGRSRSWSVTRCRWASSNNLVVLLVAQTTLLRHTRGLAGQCWERSRQETLGDTAVCMGSRLSSQRRDYSASMRDCLECQHLRARCLESSERLAAVRERLAQFQTPEVSPAFQDLSAECREVLSASRFLRTRLLGHLRRHGEGANSLAVAAIQ